MTQPIYIKLSKQESITKQHCIVKCSMSWLDNGSCCLYFTCHSMFLHSVHVLLDSDCEHPHLTTGTLCVVCTDQTVSSLQCSLFTYVLHEFLSRLVSVHWLEFVLLFDWLKWIFVPPIFRYTVRHRMPNSTRLHSWSIDWLWLLI
jgi:hypothetical protein